jgi:hypothetical protein
MKSIRFLYRNECAHARARERERETSPKNLSGIHNKRQKVVSIVVKTTHHARARINIQTHTRIHTHIHTERENLIKGTAL